MITFLNIGNLGRLANQMFQFSATLGIARKNRFDPKFPIENFNSQNPHSFEGGKLLDCFDIPDVYFTNYPLILRSIQYNYQEPSFKFDPSSFSLPDNTNINGYFQSQKYFLEIRKEITDIFKFRKEVVDKAFNLENSIDFEKSVSVHVRRGDYLASPDHHPVQTMDYYKNAFLKHSDFKKIIFSDDPDWCESNFQLDGDSFIVREDNPYVTLYLMTKFNKHVISNSSFSWWGAWLSGKNSSVVAPKKWFGPALQHSTEDLYPENWTKI